MTTIPQTSRLSISSPAFTHGDFIPEKYSCEGQNISPPLTIGDLPEGTKSLVLIMEDIDAKDGSFCHWLIWEIPPIENIRENSAPGLQGLNSAGRPFYTGPCPPSGTHRYFFRIRAIDCSLTLGDKADMKKVEKAIMGHVLASGEIMGLFKKAGSS